MAKIIHTVASVVAVVAQVAAVVAMLAGNPALAATLQAVAAAAGAVAAVSSFFIKPPDPGGTDSDWRADPQAGIPYVVGRTALGGNLVHHSSYGKDNQYAFFITALSYGPIQEFENFYADKQQVTYSVGSGGVAIGYYQNIMWIKTQLGATPEAAALVPSHAGPWPGWDAASKLSGLAADMWELKYDVKGDHNYKNGIPKPLRVIKGVKVYDPRLDSTVPGGSGACRAGVESTYIYSENPWLHFITWALGRVQAGKRILGVGMPLAGLALATMAEAATIAETNNWKAGGVVYSTDDKWDSLKAMAQAGGGVPVRLGAQLSCLVNAPRVSLATITAKDLAGEARFVGSVARRNRINGAIPRYRSEANDWEIVPAAEVRIAGFVTADGGERTKEVELPLVQDVNQAAQLAGYEIYNGRERGPITLPLKPIWYGYKPSDCVTVDIPELGLNAQPCIIRNRSFDPASGTVTLDLVTETASKHAALGFVGGPPPVTDTTPPSQDVNAPLAGSWTLTATSVTSAGGTQPALVITGATDNDAANGVVFEYRISGSSVWIPAGIEPPTITRKEILGVNPATAYDVAVRYLSNGGQSARLILSTGTTSAAPVPVVVDADITVPAVQLPADFFGNVTDYTPAVGRWLINSGGVDVSASFTITTAPGGNPGTLAVTYTGAQYQVTGSFEATDDFTDLKMRATGSGAYAGIILDRNLHLTKLKAGAVDTTPPATPAGLALSSAIAVDADGSQAVTLTATWTANTDTDLDYYRLRLRNAGGNFIEYIVGGTRFSVPVMAGVTYEAQLQAVDKSGNISATFPTGGGVVSHVAATDAVAPAAPTANLLVQAGLGNNYLFWDNVADADLYGVEIWTNSTNNSGTATRATVVNAEPGKSGRWTHGARTAGTITYYWFKSVDTSGNVSGFSATVGPITTPQAGTADIAANAITANQIAAGTITGDKITGGTITGDKINAGTSLPGSITVGSTGVSIGSIPDTIQGANATNLLHMDYWRAGSQFAPSLEPIDLDPTGAYGRWKGISANNPANVQINTLAGPSGGSEQVLQCNSAAVSDNGCQGVFGKSEGFDSKKSYRFMVWTKSPQTQLAIGPGGFGAAVVKDLSGADQVNAYFVPALVGAPAPPNKWWLVVGIVHGSDYTGGDTGEAGIYDPASGVRVVAGTEYKWIPGITRAQFTFYYYNLAGQTGYWARPSIEERQAGTYSIQQILATIGAPSGTMVGSLPADRVVTGISNISAHALTTIGANAANVTIDGLSAISAAPAGWTQGVCAPAIEGAVYVEADVAPGNIYTIVALDDDPTSTDYSTNLTTTFWYNPAVGGNLYVNGTSVFASVPTGLSGKIRLVWDKLKLYVYVAGVERGNYTPSPLPSSLYPKWITYNAVRYTGLDCGSFMADPATTVNQRSTTILPGKILIQGATTLADWRNGGDLTKIEGGSIAANTVTANKLKIGDRGINIQGIEFQYDPVSGLLSWTAGTIYFQADDGTETFNTMGANAIAWPGASCTLCWQKGANGAAVNMVRLGTAETARATANTIVLATWWANGPNFIANYGGTIIDGSKIVTGTVAANRIVAGSITATQLATSQLISANSQLGNAVVQRLTIAGSGQIIVPQVTAGGDVSLPSGGSGAGAVTNVGITGSVTVGDGTYGTAFGGFSCWVDSGTQTDGAAQFFLDANVNGAGFSQVATCTSGARVSGGDVYFRMPAALSWISGGTCQSVALQVRAQSIVMPGASGSRALTVRNPVWVIQGGAR